MGDASASMEAVDAARCTNNDPRRLGGEDAEGVRRGSSIAAVVAVEPVIPDPASVSAGDVNSACSGARSGVVGGVINFSSTINEPSSASSSAYVTMSMKNLFH